MLRTLRAHLAAVAAQRSVVMEANDAVIATAGLLQGFAGAGASNRVLLFTAVAATTSGALSVGGAAWAEDAAEREAQVLVAERERDELAADLGGEIDELAERWEQRGLDPHLAHEVAVQLTSHDALGAQLESEHGFAEPMPTSLPIWSGLVTASAYAIGGAIPFLITYFAPVDVEFWMIAAAVLISLVITSTWAARSGRLRPQAMLLRTLVVGGATMAVSYAVGELLL